MTVLTQHGRVQTTSGSIAVANLNAQIDGLTALLHPARSAHAATAPLTAADMTPLVDLLLLRGQVLGRIADYERAAGLAEAMVRDVPDDGAAWLARARTQATFHRFGQALADLDAAGGRGADRAALESERAAILQAVGRHAEALVLRRTAVERRPDFTTLGALAVLQAERGQVTEAERLFTEAPRRYRGVSPFPIADLDFRRGLMWQSRDHLHTAHHWFDAAVRRVTWPRPGGGPPRRGRRRPWRPRARHRPTAAPDRVQRRPRLCGHPRRRSAQRGPAAGGRAVARHRRGALPRTRGPPSGGLRPSRGRLLAHRGRRPIGRTPAPRAGSREPLRHRRTTGSRWPGPSDGTAPGCRHGVDAPGASGVR